MEGGSYILIVDDDAAIRDFVSLVLMDEGYAVQTAPNGRVALAHVRENIPDLILLDIQMPEMNGFEFADRYREVATPHAPIVVFTAANKVTKAVEQICAISFLSKPFNLDDLLDTVAQHVSNS